MTYLIFDTTTSDLLILDDEVEDYLILGEVSTESVEFILLEDPHLVRGSYLKNPLLRQSVIEDPNLRW